MNVLFLYKEKNKGFSLIELVVVLTLFLIIGAVTVNIFISIVKNQRRVVEEQELLNQVSFASEYMSKALRSAIADPNGACLGVSGRVYLLPFSRCPNGTLEACNGIKFVDSSDNNACKEFFLDISVNPINPPLREIKNGVTQNLLSDKLIIKHGRFIINGDKALHVVASGGATQPKVTFLLEVSTAANQSKKIIQSTISQMIADKGESSGESPGGFSCNILNQCVEGGGGASCIPPDDCELTLP